MGKLALFLNFYFHVFSADSTENRKHIHIISRSGKHKGRTIAKIWIEKGGQKYIEIEYSCLSSEDEEKIIKAIDKHWLELNRKIEEVFKGKKVRILKIK